MIRPGFGLTKRHLPSVVLVDNHFRPWTALGIMWKMRSWSTEATPTSFTLFHGKTRIDSTRHTASLMVAEWAPIYEKYYLPSFSIDGKSVFDIGAGSGETAYFYLTHGARKVIAVERDPNAARLLQQNVEQNSWNVEVINGGFELGMLDSKEYDFMKMDIEGGEEVLLEYSGRLRPSVIEAHGEILRDELMQKFQLRYVTRVWRDRYLVKTEM